MEKTNKAIVFSTLTSPVNCFTEQALAQIVRNSLDDKDLVELIRILAKR